MELRRNLAWAGALLIGIGLVQFAGVTWFWMQGGLEGWLSPVTVAAMMWPVAALLVFLGARLAGLLR